jgi:hypothetical protein
MSNVLERIPGKINWHTDNIGPHMLSKTCRWTLTPWGNQRLCASQKGYCCRPRQAAQQNRIHNRCVRETCFNPSYGVGASVMLQTATTMSDSTRTVLSDHSPDTTDGKLPLILLKDRSKRLHARTCITTDYHGRRQHSRPTHAAVAPARAHPQPEPRSQPTTVHTSTACSSQPHTTRTTHRRTHSHNTTHAAHTGTGACAQNVQCRTRKLHTAHAQANTHSTHCTY